MGKLAGNQSKSQVQGVGKYILYEPPSVTDGFSTREGGKRHEMLLQKCLGKQAERR